MTRRGWLLFWTMCALWGVPYLLIRVAGREVSPFVLVVARTGVAALILLPWAGWRGDLRGLWRHRRLVLGFAVIEITLPFTLIAYGEQHLSSSLTGLLVAAVPLCVALLALRFDAGERVRGVRLVGLGVGFGGVALLLGLDVGGDRQALLAAGAVLLAAVSYAAGALLIKRAAATVPPLALPAGGLAVATLLLAVPAALTAPSSVPSMRALLALAVLAVVCTAIALVLFTALVAEVGPSRSTVITYVNPAVAVALGVALLGEPVTAATGAGFLLILAGSWLSTGGAPPPRLVALVRRALPGLPRSGRRHRVSPSSPLARAAGDGGAWPRSPDPRAGRRCCRA